MKPLMTIILLACSIVSFSQSLEIYNSTSAVKIKSTDFLEVNVRLSDNKKCCDYIYFEGYFTSILEDSLRFNFSNSKTDRKLQNENVGYNLSYLNEYSNKVIAKKDILNITQYSSIKNKKVRKNLSTIGGLIIFSGIVTSLNGLIFGGNKKNDMLIAGGVQIGSGIVLAIAVNKRKKRFDSVNDPWRIK